MSSASLSPTPTIQQKFATKLTHKLHGLQDTSSKETLQTLAKWIAFHRKHANDSLIAVLMDSEVGILNSKKGSRTASVLNELLLLNKDQPSRWERLADLRLAVGEQLLAAITSAREVDADAENKDASIEQGLTSVTIEKLGSFLSDWDKHNVFGGPTVIHQLKRKLSANSVSQSQQAAPTSNIKKQDSITATTAGDTIADAADMDDTNDDSNEPPSPAIFERETKAASIPKAAPARQKEKAGNELSESSHVAAAPLSSAVSATHAAPSSPLEITKSLTSDKTQPPVAIAAPSSSYDFESKNIPERTVDPRQLLEPCRAIATLQIARDLRNDNALQLSSLLQGMPEDVRAFTAELAERSEKEGNAAAIMDLDDPRARDFSNRTSDQLLDTDLGDALQNVRTLRDICRQQNAARQNLFELLIASRCKFGADQVAAACFAMDSEELKGRSQILADAMELEGLDIAEMEGDTTGSDSKLGDKTTKEILDEELPPLTWYKPEDASDTTKRIKVE